MPNTVTVKRRSINVTVKSTGERIVVSSPRVKIVTAGKLGPPGPGSTSGFEETQIESIVLTEYVLAHAPTGASLRVTVNGLLQHSSSYSLSGATVTLLSDLSLMPDDRLGFAYNY